MILEKESDPERRNPGHAYNRKGNGNVESEDRKRGDLTGKIIKTERKDSQDRFLQKRKDK